MSEPGLSATDLMAWVETTSQNWKRLLEQHPRCSRCPAILRV